MLRAWAGTRHMGGGQARDTGIEHALRGAPERLKGAVVYATRHRLAFISQMQYEEGRSWGDRPQPVGCPGLPAGEC
jgi:hypothetical protein